MTTFETVSVEFELTPEDWVEAALQHDRHSSQLKEAKRMVRLLVLALVALLALLFVLEGSGVLALTWVLGGAVILAVFEPLLQHSRRKQFGKFARSGIANGMFGPHRVELRPEGMRDVTKGYEWLVRWESIDRVEEGSGAFLVYTGPNALLPIPHTAFPDAASLRRFSDTFFRLRGAGGRDEPLSVPAGSGLDG